MTLPPLPLPGLCMDVGTGFRKWYSADQMNAHATAAVLAEREACAKLCDDTAQKRYMSSRSCVDYLQPQYRAATDALRDMAEAIRERSAV